MLQATADTLSKILRAALDSLPSTSLAWEEGATQPTLKPHHGNQRPVIVTPRYSRVLVHIDQQAEDDFSVTGSAWMVVVHVFIAVAAYFECLLPILSRLICVVRRQVFILVWLPFHIRGLMLKMHCP